jgi:hypothetical protein
MRQGVNPGVLGLSARISVSNPQGFLTLVDWQSAIQQVGNLRYFSEACLKTGMLRCGFQTFVVNLSTFWGRNGFERSTKFIALRGYRLMRGIETFFYRSDYFALNRHWSTGNPCAGSCRMAAATKLRGDIADV